MGRKKAQPAANNSAAPQGSAKPERGAKTAAIKALYAQGVSQASEIDEALKAQGLSTSLPVIYQTLKKLRGGNVKKRGGRRKGRPAAANTIAALASPTPRKTAASGLVASDLHELMVITEKAGGVDVVVGLLQGMKQLQ